jgi:ferric-dicitrate binding protein FerR (iron transport regulator)
MTRTPGRRRWRGALVAGLIVGAALWGVQWWDTVAP